MMADNLLRDTEKSGETDAGHLYPLRELTVEHFYFYQGKGLSSFLSLFPFVLYIEYFAEG